MTNLVAAIDLNTFAIIGALAISLWAWDVHQQVWKKLTSLRRRESDPRPPSSLKWQKELDSALGPSDIISFDPDTFHKVEDEPSLQWVTLGAGNPLKLQINNNSRKPSRLRVHLTSIAMLDGSLRVHLDEELSGLVYDGMVPAKQLAEKHPSSGVALFRSTDTFFEVLRQGDEPFSCSSKGNWVITLEVEQEGRVVGPIALCFYWTPKRLKTVDCPKGIH